MDLTKDQLAYGEQKNREDMYRQAQKERRESNIKFEDFWTTADEAWVDYRYMQLCEQSNITPW